MNKAVKGLIVTGSIIAAVLLTVGILVTDFTDNTPSYISSVEGMSTGDYLGNKAEKELKDSGPLDDFEYLFNEQEINELLATVVPTIDIPMVNLKSIYVDIKEDNSIEAEAPLWALFYKSCAKLDGYLSYDDTTIILRISEVKVNLLSSKFGIVDWVLSDEKINDIQNSLKQSGVYLTMKKDNNDIVVSMTNMQICKTIAASSKSASGLLTAAIVGGAITANNVEIRVNKSGLTGVVIHKSLL